VYGAATAQVVERYRHQFGCPTLPREWRGIWSDTHLVWIEQSAAPWMVGVQFHPEFQPTLHPVFRAWLTAGSDEQV
jgi:CTP synthase (UTP-ammonia lyase)